MKYFLLLILIVIGYGIVTQVDCQSQDLDLVTLPIGKVSPLDFVLNPVLRLATRGEYLIEDILPFCLTPADDSSECRADDSNRIEGVGENGTMFFLFTRDNPENPEFLHACGGNLPENSNFDPLRKTEIFIHGWLDGVCVTKWLREMKDELLRRGFYNVIIVDWSWGNGPEYYRGAENVYVVKTHVALLIRNIMEETGVGPEKFHLVGQSFGAQIAGLAGQLVPNLRRITGLDPALEPFYNKPVSERLDPTDAVLVDVIHSNGGMKVGETLGDIQPLGDADFYPNGGTTQVSCKPYILKSALKLDLFYAAVSVLPIFCNHLQAIQYYKESINPTECEFIGFECPSYEDFKAGLCSSCGRTFSRCAVMGMDFEYRRHPAPTKRRFRTYYLNTTIAPPYCIRDDDQTAV